MNKLYLTVDLEKDPWNGLIPEAETDLILDILSGTNQKITFFVSGEVYDERPALINRVLEGGHEIGLHSFSHRRIANTITLEEELNKSQKFITDFKPKGFRAPYVHLPKGSLDILKQAGFKYDASSYFFKRQEKNVIMEFPTSAIKLGFLGGRDFSLPLSFSFALKKGLFPLGGAIITTLLPKLQISLLKKFNSCVIFMHPWQFSDHPFLQTIVGRPSLLLYRRNCSNVFEIMVKEFNLRRLDERLYEEKL